jgi:hypothetical protein
MVVGNVAEVFILFKKIKGIHFSNQSAGVIANAGT